MAQKLNEKATTKRLAEFIVSLSDNDLDSEAFRHAKMSILDAVGCAVNGSQFDHSKIIARFALEQGGVRESTIIAQKDKALSYLAAMANSVMVHGIEFDDTHPIGPIHIGAAIIPVALALGEREKIDGKQFATSVIIGYDVAARIAAAVTPSLRLRGFHPTAVVGCFGAAASASRILGLDAEKTCNALGLAGTQTSGLGEYGGSMSKRINPALAARNGIMAALLAQRGFTGPHAILEGDRGFFRAFSDKTKPESVFENIGKFFEITRNGYKLYACSRQVHPAINGALDLIEKNSIAVEDIKELRVGKVKWAAEATKEFRNPTPETMLAGQMSIPYALATAIIERRLLPSDFGPNRLRNSKRLDLAQKIIVFGDQNLDDAFQKDPVHAAYVTTVTIVDKTGKTYTTRIDYPKGEVQNPPTLEELLSKFRGLSREVLSEESVETIENTIMQLEKLSDVSTLTEQLRGL